MVQDWRKSIDMCLSTDVGREFSFSLLPPCSPILLHVSNFHLLLNLNLPPLFLSYPSGSPFLSLVQPTSFGFKMKNKRKKRKKELSCLSYPKWLLVGSQFVVLQDVSILVLFYSIWFPPWKPMSPSALQKHLPLPWVAPCGKFYLHSVYCHKNYTDIISSVKTWACPYMIIAKDSLLHRSISAYWWNSK